LKTAPAARPRTALLLCSHGGHLTEMLALAEALHGWSLAWWTYDAPTTRVLECPGTAVIRVPNRPYSPLEHLRNFLHARRVLRRLRPHLVLSTGAEVALAPMLAARLAGIPVLHVECGCQVRHPSMTGRLATRLANAVWVQWPELIPALGGRAACHGSLIDEARADDAA
jgi:UDP-N-acetylglucosamine:LPS N-acetylglucosamine transferase